MSFLRYPKHKESGVEWLGTMPEHWSIAQIKRTTYLKARVGWKGLTSEEFRESAYAFLVTGSDFREKFVNWNECYQVDQARYQDDPFIQLKNGDLLITKDGTIGKLAIVSGLDRPACLNSGIFVARPRNTYTTEFMYWVLSSNAFSVFCDLESFGSTINHLYQNVFERFSFPAPTETEQIRIAAFLDRETAKIDELVAEQRRLMDLLKEKRQAVISHAVTKGLDPKAKLKPSGIEWLGDVPAHWRVGKCGFYLTIISGFAFPSSGFSEDESNPKLLRGINVGVSRLKWDETVYWQREPDDGLDIYEMRVGDLVIGMDRPLIAEGIRVAKVKETDLPCLLLQRVASLKAGSQLNADYFMALLSSEMFVAHFAPETTGVSVPHISPEQIYNFVIPVPPIAEQEEIARCIDSETAQFDALTAEAQRVIDLLQERRTALISAAVTGQIDVRGLAPTHS